MFEPWSNRHKSLPALARSATGFTLLELLVVIAVIGLLSTISILALNNARHQSKVARVKADMNQFMKAVVLAQGETGLTLGAMTGSFCSRCNIACGVYPPEVTRHDLRNVPDDNPCYVRWITSLINLETVAGGLAVGVDKIQRDPWGSPYLLDENECEGGTKVNPDSICSAGPDGTWLGGDNICFIIPKLNRCP